MKATFIRSRFFRPFLRLALAPFWLLLICHTELSVIALIGIILLIGIVKKNAIMMVDFAIDAERTKKQVPKKRSTRPACCAFVPS